MSWLIVVAGAIVGAPLRHLTDRALRAAWDSPFPWGTFVVNVLGSAVLGLVTGALGTGAAPHSVQLLVGTGFCGALTTYSTFSHDALRLAEAGRRSLAACYVVGSVLAGLGAVYVGGALALAAG